MESIAKFTHSSGCSSDWSVSSYNQFDNSGKSELLPDFDTNDLTVVYSGFLAELVPPLELQRDNQWFQRISSSCISKSLLGYRSNGFGKSFPCDPQGMKRQSEMKEKVATETVFNKNWKYLAGAAALAVTGTGIGIVFLFTEQESSTNNAMQIFSPRLCRILNVVGSFIAGGISSIAVGVYIGSLRAPGLEDKSSAAELSNDAKGCNDTFNNMGGPLGITETACYVNDGPQDKTKSTDNCVDLSSSMFNLNYGENAEMTPLAEFCRKGFERSKKWIDGQESTQRLPNSTNVSVSPTVDEANDDTLVDHDSQSSLSEKSSKGGNIVLVIHTTATSPTNISPNEDSSTPRGKVKNKQIKNRYESGNKMLKTRSPSLHGMNPDKTSSPQEVDDEPISDTPPNSHYLEENRCPGLDVSTIAHINPLEYRNLRKKGRFNKAGIMQSMCETTVDNNASLYHMNKSRFTQQPNVASASPLKPNPSCMPIKHVGPMWAANNRSFVIAGNLDSSSTEEFSSQHSPAFRLSRMNNAGISRGSMLPASDSVKIKKNLQSKLLGAGSGSIGNADLTETDVSSPLKSTVNIESMSACPEQGSSGIMQSSPHHRFGRGVHFSGVAESRTSSATSMKDRAQTAISPISGSLNENVMRRQRTLGVSGLGVRRSRLAEVVENNCAQSVCLGPSAPPASLPDSSFRDRIGSQDFNFLGTSVRGANAPSSVILGPQSPGRKVNVLNYKPLGPTRSPKPFTGERRASFDRVGAMSPHMLPSAVRQSEQRTIANANSTLLDKQSKIDEDAATQPFLSDVFNSVGSQLMSPHVNLRPNLGMQQRHSLPAQLGSVSNNTNEDVSGGAGTLHGSICGGASPEIPPLLLRPVGERVNPMFKDEEEAQYVRAMQAAVMQPHLVCEPGSPVIQHRSSRQDSPRVEPPRESLNGSFNSKFSSPRGTGVSNVRPQHLAALVPSEAALENVLRTVNDAVSTAIEAKRTGAEHNSTFIEQSTTPMEPAPQSPTGSEKAWSDFSASGQSKASGRRRHTHRYDTSPVRSPSKSPNGSISSLCHSSPRFVRTVSEVSIGKKKYASSHRDKAKDLSFNKTRINKFVKSSNNKRDDGFLHISMRRMGPWSAAGSPTRSFYRPSSDKMSQLGGDIDNAPLSYYLNRHSASDRPFSADEGRLDEKDSGSAIVHSPSRKSRSHSPQVSQHEVHDYSEQRESMKRYDSDTMTPQHDVGKTSEFGIMTHSRERSSGALSTASVQSRVRKELPRAEYNSPKEVNFFGNLKLPPLSHLDSPTDRRHGNTSIQNSPQKTADGHISDIYPDEKPATETLEPDTKAASLSDNFDSSIKSVASLVQYEYVASPHSLRQQSDQKMQPMISSETAPQLPPSTQQLMPDVLPATVCTATVIVIDIRPPPLPIFLHDDDFDDNEEDFAIGMAGRGSGGGEFDSISNSTIMAPLGKMNKSQGDDADKDEQGVSGTEKRTTADTEGAASEKGREAEEGEDLLYDEVDMYFQKQYLKRLRKERRARENYIKAGGDPEKYSEIDDSIVRYAQSRIAYIKTRQALREQQFYNYYRRCQDNPKLCKKFKYTKDFMFLSGTPQSYFQPNAVSLTANDSLLFQRILAALNEVASIVADYGGIVYRVEATKLIAIFGCTLDQQVNSLLMAMRKNSDGGNFMSPYGSPQNCSPKFSHVRNTQGYPGSGSPITTSSGSPHQGKDSSGGMLRHDSMVEAAPPAMGNSSAGAIDHVRRATFAALAISDELEYFSKEVVSGQNEFGNEGDIVIFFNYGIGIDYGSLVCSTLSPKFNSAADQSQSFRAASPHQSGSSAFASRRKNNTSFRRQQMQPLPYSFLQQTRTVQTLMGSIVLTGAPIEMAADLASLNYHLSTRILMSQQVQDEVQADTITLLVDFILNGTTTAMKDSITIWPDMRDQTDSMSDGLELETSSETSDDNIHDKITVTGDNNIKLQSKTKSAGTENNNTNVKEGKCSDNEFFNFGVNDDVIEVLTNTERPKEDKKELVCNSSRIIRIPPATHHPEDDQYTIPVTGVFELRGDVQELEQYRKEVADQLMERKAQRDARHMKRQKRKFAEAARDAKLAEEISPNSIMPEIASINGNLSDDNFTDNVNKHDELVKMTESYSETDDDSDNEEDEEDGEQQDAMDEGGVPGFYLPAHLLIHYLQAFFLFRTGHYRAAQEHLYNKIPLYYLEMDYQLQRLGRLMTLFIAHPEFGRRFVLPKNAVESVATTLTRCGQMDNAENGELNCSLQPIKNDTLENSDKEKSSLFGALIKTGSTGSSGASATFGNNSASLNNNSGNALSFAPGAGPFYFRHHYYDNWENFEDWYFRWIQRRMEREEVTRLRKLIKMDEQQRGVPSSVELQKERILREVESRSIACNTEGVLQVVRKVPEGSTQDSFYLTGTQLMGASSTLRLLDKDSQRLSLSVPFERINSSNDLNNIVIQTRSHIINHSSTSQDLGLRSHTFSDEENATGPKPYLSTHSILHGQRSTAQPAAYCTGERRETPRTRISSAASANDITELGYEMERQMHKAIQESKEKRSRKGVKFHPGCDMSVPSLEDDAKKTDKRSLSAESSSNMDISTLHDCHNNNSPFPVRSFGTGFYRGSSELRRSATLTDIADLFSQDETELDTSRKERPGARGQKAMTRLEKHFMQHEGSPMPLHPSTSKSLFRGAQVSLVGADLRSTTPTTSSPALGFQFTSTLKPPGPQPVVNGLRDVKHYATGTKKYRDQTGDSTTIIKAIAAAAKGEGASKQLGTLSGLKPLGDTQTLAANASLGGEQPNSSTLQMGEEKSGRIVPLIPLSGLEKAASEVLGSERIGKFGGGDHPTGSLDLNSMPPLRQGAANSLSMNSPRIEPPGADSAKGILTGGVYINSPDIWSDTGQLAFYDTKQQAYRRGDKVLGTGAFGKVFLGMRQNDGRLIAIKTLQIPNIVAAEEVEADEKKVNKVSTPKTTEEEQKNDDETKAQNPVSQRQMIIAQRRRMMLEKRGKQKVRADQGPAAVVVVSNNARKERQRQKQQEDLQQLMHEVLMLCQLRHSNIVQFIGCGIIGDKVLLNLEFVSGGSLQTIIEEFGALPVAACQRYLKDILRGLAYLHSQRLIHLDIKPANVLLTVEGHCKVTDFGTSIKVASLLNNKGTAVGTPLYMSPEHARGGKHLRTQSDIFSVGLMAYKMLTGKLPYQIDDHIAMHRHIYRLGHDPSYVDEINSKIRPEDLPSMQAYDFIRQCLQKEWRLRGTAEGLQMHGFLYVVEHSNVPTSLKPVTSMQYFQDSHGVDQNTGGGGTSLITGALRSARGHRRQYQSMQAENSINRADARDENAHEMQSPREYTTSSPLSLPPHSKYIRSNLSSEISGTHSPPRALNGKSPTSISPVRQNDNALSLTRQSPDVSHPNSNP